jgi:site-specific DNA-adenine methylase
MWSYYGAKGNVINLYPPPKHGLIIEPFAGTGRYALKYWERDVILIDKYVVMIKIWKWLQSCSKNDVLSMPRFIYPGQTINDLKFECIEAKLLMGFLIGKGSERPRNKPSPRMVIHRPNHANYHIQRIAKDLHKIKHWKIIEGDYRNIDNTEATWYIDPPYQYGGDCYVINNKTINYAELSEWCKTRMGQVIVCENTKADWLPFNPIKRQRGSIRSTTEAIWCNYETSYNSKQTNLFI